MALLKILLVRDAVETADRFMAPRMDVDSIIIKIFGCLRLTPLFYLLLARYWKNFVDTLIQLQSP